MRPAREVPVTVASGCDARQRVAVAIVAGLALVPTEHVLLVALHLPLASARRRREALPFAMEEFVSEPLETLHFVLGEAVGQQRYLAAATSQETMRTWLSALAEQGVTGAALVPDVITVPVPEEGHWTVLCEGERALVRTADGGGFATRLERLPSFWAHAGRPGIRAPHDAALPADLPVERMSLAPIDLAPGKRPPIDLRQGAFAQWRAAPAPGHSAQGTARTLISGHWRRVAFLTAAGLAAHGAIAAADTLALTSIARQTKAETEDLIAMARPGAYLGGDLVDTAASLLPETEQRPAPFLPLLASATRAMGSNGAAIRFESLDWSDADQSLRVRLHLPDAATLDSLRARLRTQGLGVDAKLPVRTAEGYLVDMVLR
jgi:general secretion pathway protein L